MSAEEKRIAVIKLYKQGNFTIAILKQLKISCSTVHKAIKNY